MNHLPLEQHTASSWQLPVEARQFRAHADGFAAQQPAYNRHRPQQPPLEGIFEREHLFEKPLTPSDVGKLNRLVIPKQHAERYFPLDGESGEKGLLLSFEDEAGKAWRFRYSYWTSSQSYVLTKGWSRFVKEKRLDAGDVVLFEKRRRSTGDRLYIGWKRRIGAQDGGSVQTADAAGAAQLINPEECYPAAAPQHHHPYSCHIGVNPVHDSSGEQGVGQVPYAARPPSAVTATNSKRLRLFGVNLECGPELEPEPLLPGSGSGAAVGGAPCMEIAGDCGRRSLHLPYMHAGGAFYES